MSGCSREPGYCSDCDVKSDDEDEDDGCYECGAYESVKQCSECDKIFCPAHGPHYEYLDEPDVIYCVSCLESLKKRGLLSVGHECGTVICPDCKKDPDADNYNDSCMCGLDKSDDSWCNADCEKAEGCIECNPMAFCSAETFAKWQDDCVSRMNPITNE